MTLMSFQGGCHCGLGSGARRDARVTVLLLLLTATMLLSLSDDELLLMLFCTGTNSVPEMRNVIQTPVLIVKDSQCNSVNCRNIIRNLSCYMCRHQILNYSTYN